MGIFFFFFVCGSPYRSMLSSGLGENMGFDGSTHSSGLTIHHVSSTATALAIVTPHFFGEVSQPSANWMGTLCDMP